MSEPLHHAPRRRKLTSLALALLTATGLLAFAPGAAQAAAAPADHCVVNLSTGETTCAATQAGALAADAAAAEDVGIMSVTLITLYDRTNYDPAGGTRSFVADGSYTCSAAYSPVEFSVDYLDAANWNNRASSVHTYRSCDIKLWDTVTLSGASSTWIDNLANLDTIGWANRAGSYQIS
ncbi:hypothetical protein [Glycomyces sp. NPDC048151]|uniref:hypothetical protein n=1 Tax=Glycomyces sp. NPDC048151 TaxID=3364002 RepID=UPI003718DDC0